MTDSKKTTTKLKLSLKKETLRELPDCELTLLDQVVGGTGAPALADCRLTVREIQA